MEELNDKIAVSVQPFNGKIDDFSDTEVRNPMVGLRDWWGTSSYYRYSCRLCSSGIDEKRKS